MSKRIRWTPAEDAILRANHFAMKSEAVAELLDRTVSAVVTRASKLGLKASNTQHRWTEEEKKFLRQHYPTWSNTKLEMRMKISKHKIQQHAQVLGLKKTRPTWLRIQRRNGHLMAKKHLGNRFRPGDMPANWGKKLSPEQYERSSPTMFKKGQVCRNLLPVGTEIRRGDGYLYRKVGDDRTILYRYNWKQAHLILWEEQNGPVPLDHVITFRDGDKEHITIENLECISKAERASRNRRQLSSEAHRALAFKAWKTRRLRAALLEKGVDVDTVARARA